MFVWFCWQGKTATKNFVCFVLLAGKSARENFVCLVLLAGKSAGENFVSLVLLAGKSTGENFVSLVLLVGKVQERIFFSLVLLAGKSAGENFVCLVLLTEKNLQERRPEELCVPDKPFVLPAAGRHQVLVEININKSNSMWKVLRLNLNIFFLQNEHILNSDKTRKRKFPKQLPVLLGQLRVVGVTTQV